MNIRCLIASLAVCGWAAVAPVHTRAQAPAKPPSDTSSDASPVKDQPVVAELIFKQANRFRASQELGEVHTNAELAAAAREFAAFLAKTGKFSHTADDRKPRERANAHGYDFCIVAENIGLQFGSEALTAEALARGLVEGWKDSKEHRANLLDPDVTETGVAVAQSEKTGKYYAVQLFGRPKSQSIRVEIENRADVTVKYKIGEESFELPERAVRIHGLCRPADFAFLLPDAEGAEQTVTEHVKAEARLFIQRDESAALEVVRSSAAER